MNSIQKWYFVMMLFGLSYQVYIWVQYSHEFNLVWSVHLSVLRTPSPTSQGTPN